MSMDSTGCEGEGPKEIDSELARALLRIKLLEEAAQHHTTVDTDGQPFVIPDPVIPLEILLY